MLSSREIHQQLALNTSSSLSANENNYISLKESTYASMKSNMLRLNTTCERPTTLEGESLEEVEAFIYLDSVVDTQGGTEADVTTRISKARAPFHILRNEWRSNTIDYKTTETVHSTHTCHVHIRSRT